MKARPHRDETATATEIDYVGGHVALNFLNTSRLRNGSPIDILQTDKDVLRWMQTMQHPEPLLEKPLREGTLLLSARRLREILLEVIQLRKAGKRGVPGQLNRLLESAKSHLVFKPAQDDVRLTRIYKASNAEEFLAPLTDMIAEMLANEDLNLVRQCEGDICVLWFLDTTKGHRRRWCSADSCGTRARVAAFRARKAGNTSPGK